MNNPTLHELQSLASDLKGNDWATFADRISERWPALGAFEALHAEAADHCSPPVHEWPAVVLSDWQDLVSHGALTAASAQLLWRELYTDVVYCHAGHEWAAASNEAECPTCRLESETE
jgi:hypothetical protein